MNNRFREYLEDNYSVVERCIFLITYDKSDEDIYDKLTEDNIDELYEKLQDILSEDEFNAGHHHYLIAKHLSYDPYGLIELTKIKDFMTLYDVSHNMFDEDYLDTHDSIDCSKKICEILYNYPLEQIWSHLKDIKDRCIHFTNNNLNTIKSILSNDDFFMEKYSINNDLNDTYTEDNGFISILYDYACYILYDNLYNILNVSNIDIDFYDRYIEFKLNEIIERIEF